ncbi:hypothetical protein EK0264_11660 [Epidermidibacterium keratini]|uniref:Uncharacterized protein n=1 Tax=Epidermidibacterium keratini TaxID=1891644 RepID=A0A7L4YP04_9ACTN|nr:hypothetical protein [Epidermidibacterium keratini]QHC00876.1 hypothetical protein EK0264_11660 [Epidermidibacterium keratini]
MTEASPFGPANLDVQPQALVDFSTKVKDHASTSNDTMGPAMQDLGSAEFGGAPVPSASLALRGYARANLELGKFIEDLGAGSAAFMIGSLTIAANYVISDDAGKDQMQDVDAAFNVNGVPKEQTVLGVQDAQNQQTQEAIDNIQPEPLPEPTEPEQTVCTATGSPPDSPEEMAQREVSEIYNDEESGAGAAYASVDAPLSVQQEMAGVTEDDRYIPVVDNDGNTKYIENPGYTGPTYDYSYPSGI